MSNAEYQSTSDEDLDGQDDADDDAMFDDDGYTEITPSFDELAMLNALEDPPDSEPQAELAPQEAYEAMKFMAPLDDEEEVLLRETPFLQADPRGHGAPISWVDDPDHTEFIINRMQARQKAMDEVLEDEMYGESSMTEEELMDRAGSEVGFGLSSLKRAAKRVGRTAVRTTRLATRPIAKLVSVVKRFVPGRDAGKAKMVKDLNTKLIKEHANYLATIDRKRGVTKPVASYLATSRLWAKNKIQQAGLPTSFTSGSDIAGDILGSDSCGDWWNPLSWFSSKTKYVLLNTQGERVAELSEAEYQAAQAASQQPTDQAQPPAEEPPSEEPPPEEPPPDESEGDDWSSTLTSAFDKGRQAGGLFSSDDSQGDAHMNATRSYRHPALRSMSAGAYEEAMIEKSGDADVHRKFHRGRRRGGLRSGSGGRGLQRGGSPEAQRLRSLIKQQVPSGVVSEALVKKWAAARAGAPSGAMYDRAYACMSRCLAKRKAVISSNKSETVGSFVGDFVGWA